MQFEYEIPVEEYVSAQTLYYKSSGKNRQIKRALGCILLGLLFVAIGVFRAIEWAPVLLLLTGAWLIYGGIASLFPKRYFRRLYPDQGFEGKKYRAEVDETGFSVSGDGCAWRVLWTDAPLRREDNRVFMFFGKGVLFIFGKTYLTAEQQNQIRQFAGLE